MSRGRKNNNKRSGALALIRPAAPAIVESDNNLPALPTTGRLGRMFAEAQTFRTEGAELMEQDWNAMGASLHRTRTMVAAGRRRAEFVEQEVLGLLTREGLLEEDEKGDPKR